MTPREHQALAYIEGYIAEAGYPPRLSDIAAHLGGIAKSRVHRLLSSLEEQGRIARHPFKTRNITVLAGVAATGARAITDLLAAVPTDALRLELNRRQETDNG